MDDLPYWKVLLLTIGILILALGLIQGAALLGLEDLWVAFVALTVWSAAGADMEQAPSIYIGGALGLLIAWLLETLTGTFGAAGAIIPLLAIIFCISCQIKGWLPLFCNFGTFVFLTIGTADVFAEPAPHLIYMQNLAFGAVCFWILPWVVLKLRGKSDEEPSS